MITIRAQFDEIGIDYAIVDKDAHTLLAVSAFDSSVVRCRSVCVRTNGTVSIQWRNYNGKGKMSTRFINTLPVGRDSVTSFLSVSSLIGEEYVVTTSKWVYSDMYQLLMQLFTLPLQEKWMPALVDELMITRGKKDFFRALEICRNSVICDEDNRAIELHSEAVPLRELVVYKIGLDQETLEEVVSKLLRNRTISICDGNVQELSFEGMDEYFATYGKYLSKNLDNVVKPIIPLDGFTENAVMKSTRMYPQQSACVNGVVELLKHQNYAYLVEGMGSGKTIQGCAIAEAMAIGEYRRKHPEESLEDIVGCEGKINYRVIIMCPSHLTNKWGETIRHEVPYAKVIDIKGLSELVALRASGSKRNGKEWYIVSKDKAKLGDTQSPSPSRMATRMPALQYCADCDKDGTVSWRAPGQQRCDRCGGSNWKKRYFSEYRTTGMVCPSCDELLIDFRAKQPEEELDTRVLTDSDFRKATSKNRVCYHCGEQLWGSEVETLTLPGVRKRESKWVKISHYANLTKKSRTSSFVLKNRVLQYIQGNNLKQGEYDVNEKIAGSRKYAPARYIKKYLKGYFDLAIFDEAHLLEGGATAQGIAMHAIIKASKKAIALTGTISNGYATNLFYLFWRFSPAKMSGNGWKFTEVNRFAKEYGTVETLYELSDGGAYNSSSRGRQLSAPKVKPGISPLIYTDFLLDSCVQLDLTDMSEQLPELKEEVITVPLDSDILSAYRNGCDTLSKASQENEGMGILAQMLNFSLFYPDHPYGWKPIMSPYTENKVILEPSDFSWLLKDDNGNERLLAKEAKLVEIINSELSKGRNCFIFAECSGSEDTYILGRLQYVLERFCGLKDSVQVMESSSASAQSREEWIHTRAAQGKKVFICNPRLVETGLDLLWESDGVRYNYPTLIFFQLGYSLSTVWQASRRHYRLNQTEECRTYYLAYEGTVQTNVVQMMAQKQVAVSAIQGKFSADGLASMAKGVDSRLVLAKKMRDGAGGVDKNELVGMFDVMNAKRAESDDSYSKFKRNVLFSELCGEEKELVAFVQTEAPEIDIFELAASIETAVQDETPKKEVSLDAFASEEVISDIGDLFEDLFEELKKAVGETDETDVKKSKKKVPAGQISFF